MGTRILTNFVYLFSEGKRLPTLSEKNKVSGCKWRELTNEERQIYNEMAQNETATCASTISRKKEMRRALSSLTNIVSIHHNYRDVNKHLPCRFVNSLSFSNTVTRP